MDESSSKDSRAETLESGLRRGWGWIEMGESRKALHAFVSNEAHEQWHETALTWGISVSALLEALAPELDDIDSLFGARSSDIVTTARRTDAARRRRRK